MFEERLGAFEILGWGLHKGEERLWFLGRGCPASQAKLWLVFFDYLFFFLIMGWGVLILTVG